MPILFAPENPIVIASHNEGKIIEFGDLLAPFGLQVKSASDFNIDEPEETGTTFQANAELKALHSARQSGHLAIADDSGLSVDALNGDPGIYSARWAGSPRDFNIAMQRVQDELTAKGITQENVRTASFICVLCVATPHGETHSFTGHVHGTIVWPPRGNQGFGYDSIFRPHGETRTYGEMTRAEKHGNWQEERPGLSHRANAFRQFFSAYFM